MTDPISIALAAATAAGVVVYWAFCRRVSLRHREKAAELLGTYFQDESVSKSDKDSIYFTYRWASNWTFLPVVAVGGVLVMPFMLLSGKAISRKQSESHTEIMDSIMKMYITRNPITAVVCFQAIFIQLALFGIIGLLFDRLKAIPTPSMIVSSMATKAAHSPLGHHAH